MNALLSDIRETQRVLEEHLARARGARPSVDPDHPRDQYPPIDTYLAHASRHLSAVIQVLVPAARSRLPDGSRRAKEFLSQSRQVAVALNQVKARLYGSTFAAGRSWSSIWDVVEREYAKLEPLEVALAEDLNAHRRQDDPDWVLELHRAEVHAPTRPHPNIPQQGVAGSVARRVARRVDLFWDAAEGRMVPEPERHHPRDEDSLLVQYLLADPHLENWPEPPEAIRRALEDPDQAESALEDPDDQTDHPDDPAPETDSRG